MKNVIIDTDAYKLTHWLQGKKGLTKLYSYAEPRVGGKYSHISWFGLRMIIKDHFLQRITDQLIARAHTRSLRAFDTPAYFNKDVWEKVKKLGYYPIEIKAAPEGTRLEAGNVAFTITSTQDWFASSLNALESTLLHVWYPTAVATRAMHIKEAIQPWFEKSSEIASIMLPYAVNDFGYRGSTCWEAAARGGAAFLVHFAGSDNLPAMELIHDCYGCEDRLKSVWATEHSVATAFGLELNNEKEYLLHQLTAAPDDKIISIVIDSKDSDVFIRDVVGDPEIKSLIRARAGRVVFRPDSGDPKRNILKYLDMLGGLFGFRVNQLGQGYKVLNHNVGLIQGDGMTETSIPDLYKEIVTAGWAADNVVTGSGGGLLQEGLSRDTSRWALKASYGERNGVGFNIQKNPGTDPTKKSKPGMLKLTPIGHNFMTVSSADMSKAEFEAYVDRLETVFLNGEFYPETFDNILKRAK